MKCVYTDSFVGPLGLLLELIEKRGLAVDRVSLAQVAKQYLSYVEKGEMSLDEAHDFLSVAARLVFLKARMLSGIPAAFLVKDEEEGVSLEEQVQIYAKFKEAAQGLEGIYLKNKMEVKKRNLKDEQSLEFKEEINGEALRQGFLSLLNRLPDSCMLKKEKVGLKLGIKAVIRDLKERLLGRSRLSFRETVKGMSRERTVVTFLAILEMGRTGWGFRQKGCFGDIFLLQPKE